MKFAVILFTARTQTINFYQLLKSYGIYCNLIDTPRSIQSSCGMAVKFDLHDINTAKDILRRRNFNFFNGIYIVMYEDGRECAQKIV